jgi:hypothetical protein
MGKKLYIVAAILSVGWAIGLIEYIFSGKY